MRSSYPIASARRRDVGAGGLAQLGHGVDERDLGGEEGVGRDLDQLGGGEVGDETRRALGDRRRVHLVEQRHRPVAVDAGRDAVDETVGVQRVVDRVALAQELGVPGQQGTGVGVGQGRGEPFGGADRDGRLADDQVALGESAAEGRRRQRPHR